MPGGVVPGGVVRSRSVPGRGVRPRLGILAIVLLVAADIVLVRLAFDHVAPSGDAADPGPVPVETTPTPPRRTDGGSPSGHARDPVLPAGPLRLALAADGAVLLGSVGGCADDGGTAAPTPVVLLAAGPDRALRPVPVAEDLTGVLALDAGARDDLTLVGTDGACRTRAFEGTTSSDVWSPGPATDEWYLEFSGDVHAPGGTVDVPCAPAGLSTTGSVRLLCEGGTLLGTSDTGETWVALGRVDAAAFAFDTPSDGVALVETDDCPVALAVTVDGGADWETTACLEGATGRAVAKRGEDLVAVTDETLWRSADGGETWERHGG